MISEEENEDFDGETEEMVTELTRQKRRKLKPLDKTDYPRLLDETHLMTNKETKYLISTFKQKAPGKDRITKYHLTHLPPNMINNLTVILNACLATGYFPQIWKTSIIIFLPKPNKSPLEHTNFRPISLLDLAGKILEKAINNRLLNHLNIANRHNVRQHGFRAKRGTGTATAILYESIASGLANKYKINIVLRDVGKAFDKVWHDGLKCKTLLYNLPNYLIRIISNYLDDRQAQIRIGQFTGQAFPLLSGVPQGGCLSPTLFNLYTSDLPPPQNDNEQIIYADDITQIIKHKGSENWLVQETQKEIENINAYEKIWKIRTNKDKFQIIPINRLKTTNIIIDNTPLPMHKKGKVLGTTITSSGFATHAKERIKLASSKLSTLYRFINLSQRNKKKLYTTLIKSIIEYPPVPLHAISISMQKSMQVVQNKAARIITNTRKLDRKTSEFINKKANLTPLNISIHEQAVRTWQTVDRQIPDEILNRLTIEPDRFYHSRFQSSRSLINAATEPIY